MEQVIEQVIAAAFPLTKEDLALEDNFDIPGAMRNFYNLYIDKDNVKAAPVVNPIIRESGDISTNADVEEIDDLYNVKKAGRWISFNDRHIEFLSEGTYEKEYVNKKVKEVAESGEILTLSYKNGCWLPAEISAFYKVHNPKILTKFQAYIPIPLKGTRKLPIPSYREDLYKIAMRNPVKEVVPIKKDAIPSPSLEKHFLLDGRFLVYLTTPSTAQFSLLIENGKIIFKKLDGANHLIQGWNAVNKIQNLINTSYSASYSGFKLCLIDVIKWETLPKDKSLQVLKTLLVTHKDIISSNLLTARLKNDVAYLDLVLLDSDKFISKLNTYFAASGFPTLICTKAIPEMATYNYSEYDFTKSDYNNHNGTRAAYKCEFSYNGEMILDKSRGWCYVADDEKLTMLQSAWCQRTTRWSKETDNIVDQSNTWNILDWLTGPFFEQFNINPPEANFAFMGRNANMADKKKNVLKALKAAL